MPSFLTSQFHLSIFTKTYFVVLSSTMAAFWAGVWVWYGFTFVAFGGAGVSTAGVEAGNVFLMVLVDLLSSVNATELVNAITLTRVVIKVFIALFIFVSCLCLIWWCKYKWDFMNGCIFIQWVIKRLFEWFLLVMSDLMAFEGCFCFEIFKYGLTC